MALLEVEDLHVSFNTADGVVKAVRGLTFSVDRGQTIGIVGESGSGKSVSTQTIMGLTAGARVSGEARFEGANLLTMSDRELRSVRGAKVGMKVAGEETFAPLLALFPFDTEDQAVQWANDTSVSVPLLNRLCRPSRRCCESSMGSKIKQPKGDGYAIFVG